MTFYYHANRTHFHKKGLAPGLVLKVRVFGTRKWPIDFRHSYPVPCSFRTCVMANATVEEGLEAALSRGRSRSGVNTEGAIAVTVLMWLSVSSC